MRRFVAQPPFARRNPRVNRHLRCGAAGDRPNRLLMKVGRAATTVILGSALVLCAGAATAQFGGFGGIFDPPRPPGGVPTRPPPQPAPPQLPPPSRAAPIQSQDLPAPGAPGRPGTGPVTTLPSAPGQQRPGAATANAPPGPPPPPEDVVTPPPPQRVTNPTAVFSGLDKITGRITAFDAAIGETVQFGALQVTARACYSRPPTETPLTDGFVEVDEVTLQGEVRRIFTGWMFAASPGLHAVEHPIYDVWLTDCKGGAQAVADAQPATPTTGAQPPTPPRQGGAQQRPAAPQQPRAPTTGQTPRQSPGTLTQPGAAR
jgi:hypothetical protein